MKILATYNIKGGVGKTSTAVNIGYLAARDGSEQVPAQGGQDVPVAAQGGPGGAGQGRAL